MKIFKRYGEYLKNNPEKYWFKRKLYGYGWVPALWQGWVALAVCMVLFLFIFVPFVSNPEPSNSDVVWFLIKIFLWVVALISVCFITGEPPKWQWGLPEDKEKHTSV